MTTTKDYNGWKNRQTWNVALWLNNDYGLYTAMQDYLSQAKKPNYTRLIKYLGLENAKTPDNIKWLSTRIDYKALNEMLREEK